MYITVKATKDADEELNELIRSIDESIIYDEINKKKEDKVQLV